MAAPANPPARRALTGTRLDAGPSRSTARVHAREQVLLPAEAAPSWRRLSGSYIQSAHRISSSAFNAA